MRNLYTSVSLIGIVIVLVTAFSSCSENEEDVSAPLITINRPAENDTIHLNHSKVYIEVKAENTADIDHIMMTVITPSGNLLYKYEESQIDKHNYNCSESFSPDDIEMVTRVKLIVTCENEFHAWRKKEVNFYLAP